MSRIIFVALTLMFSFSAVAKLEFEKREFSFGSIYMPSEHPQVIVVSPSSRIVSMGISGKYNFVLSVNDETYLCNLMTTQEKYFLFQKNPCNYKQLYLLNPPPEGSEEYKLYQKFQFVLSVVFYFWPEDRQVDVDRNIETIVEEDRLTSILRVNRSKNNKRIIYKSVLDDEQKLVEQEIRVEGTKTLSMSGQEIKTEHNWLERLIEDVMTNKLDVSAFKRLCEQKNIQCNLMSNDDLIELHKRNE